jgi:hypothetical protein
MQAKQDVTAFRPTGKNGLQSWCKACECEYQRQIYANNPQKQRERRRLYVQRYSEKYNAVRRANRREAHLTESARKYHTTKDTLRMLLQAGRCEICGVEIDFTQKNVHLRPNIDHCHETKRVRGILCGYCNNLLGRAKDSPKTLRKAAAYLERF